MYRLPCVGGIVRSSFGSAFATLLLFITFAQNCTSLIAGIRSSPVLSGLRCAEIIKGNRWIIRY